MHFMSINLSFFFYWYCYHRDRHVLIHAFPTRRASDLAIHTVGTPAELVTFSAFIRSHSIFASLTAEKTNFTPATAPANGRPQAAAWNIGTTGSTTDRMSRSNTDG